MRNLLYSPVSPRASAGLLVLRLIAGAALMQHGWPKIQNPMHWMGDAFPGFLQACAALAEFGVGLAWVLGLLTPLVSLAILVNMIVALNMVHIPHHDPMVAQGLKPSMEPALLYLSIAFVLLLAGPGFISMDRFFFGRRDRY
jgi:putative oxidoreductase